MQKNILISNIYIYIYIYDQQKKENSINSWWSFISKHDKMHLCLAKKMGVFYNGNEYLFISKLNQ